MRGAGAPAGAGIRFLPQPPPPISPRLPRPAVIGLIEMFGSFLPMVLAALRNVPFLGPILSAPGVARLLDALAGATQQPRKAPV